MESKTDMAIKTDSFDSALKKAEIDYNAQLENEAEALGPEARRLYHSQCPRVADIMYLGSETYVSRFFEEPVSKCDKAARLMHVLRSTQAMMRQVVTSSSDLNALQVKDNVNLALLDFEDVLVEAEDVLRDITASAAPAACQTFDDGVETESDE